MSTDSRPLRQPSYRHHKPSGQAVVTVEGKDRYLGKYGSPESKKAYKRLMLEWVANDGHLPPEGRESILVSELCVQYKRFAKRYYAQGNPQNATFDKVARVVQFLGRSVYGATMVKDFGPLAVKALQHQLIGAGGSRSYVNDQISIIRRCFKWGVSEELVPPSVFQAIQAVPGLRRGRTVAREAKPVLPVDDAVVEATLPHLPPVVDDVVRLLRLLGCRPGELCSMRPADVDRTAEVWVFTPRHHKSEHHGRDRAIFIGPRAQAVLGPYLLRGSDEFCFSPAESVARRRAIQHANRKTPLSCGNKPGSNRQRHPKKRPGLFYEHRALNHAVRAACDKADAAAREAEKALAPEERTAADVRLVPRWHPYQLRHTAATEFRRKHGLEAAQVLLGHARADVTQVYAERDYGKAAAIMAEVG
jgi:integrase